MSMVYCQPCGYSIQADSFKSHVSGKRHKAAVGRELHRSSLEKTGLYIQGVPPQTCAAEVGEAFGRYGLISKVEIHETVAFVYYADENSREEAIKQQHFIRGKPLKVERRTFGPSSANDEGRGLKRYHHGDLVDVPKPERKEKSKKKEKRQSATAADVLAVHHELLAALASPAPVLEQMKLMKEKILVGDENCLRAQQIICQDLISALRYCFKTCDLYCFGSMTTGLAFQKSDLDIYAYLELDSRNTQVALQSDLEVKSYIFRKAKTCLNRGHHLFRRPIAIPRAKTPLIKFDHNPTKISCDLSFRDALGYCNSRLLRHYMSMNERFFDTIFFIKYWAHVKSLSTPSKLSNYSLCMLGVSYLMSLRDTEGKKLVPSVHNLQERADASSPFYQIEGWRCSFDDSTLVVTLPNTPEFSFIGMLKGFFEYIAELPFSTDVISVLTGDLVSRHLFEQSPEDLPDVFDIYKNHISVNPGEELSKPEHCAVIHDPFKICHNLLERINHSTLQELVQACKAAAKICAEAINSEEHQSTILSSLLSNSRSCSTAASYKVVPASHDVISVIIPQQPSESLHSSFEKFKNLLHGILEEILLLKITHACEPKNKVIKTENMEDVHGVTQHPVVIICEGSKEVWFGRKKAEKHLANKKPGIFTHPLSFQNEKYISDVIAKNSSKETNYKFQCEISLDEKRGKLKFLDLSQPRNRLFNAMMSYLPQRLYKWIKQFSSKPASELGYKEPIPSTSSQMAI